MDQACDEDLKKPSIELSQQVVTEITSKPSLPKEAVKFIRKKLIHQNPKVKFLALLVLEMAMDKCGYPFHQQVGTKDFMNIMMQLLQENNQTP
jgi:ADP-ribosylation factor-binding protein GGA